MTQLDRPADGAGKQSLVDKLAGLKRNLDQMGSALVAFSGGVDSTFLLKVAVDQLGDRVLAVTADSETIPRAELELARHNAAAFGARHLVVNTNEMCDPDFVANPPDRCFHCKKTLFSTLTDLAKEHGVHCVIEGSNISDVSDYRPGFKAVSQFEVRSPLKEVGLTKEEIRELSKQFGLSTWDKPAAPCLSSRIPYGSKITSEKLQRIEAAEKYIRELGFSVLRVRDHGDVARIEVPRESMTRFLGNGMSENVTARLKTLGYQYVTIDLLGFRSGSLNEALKETGDE
jgi:uncharacterized protein